MADFVDKSLEDSKGFFLGLGSGILVINKFKRERESFKNSFMDCSNHVQILFKSSRSNFVQV
jgi:hypothetical protein